MNSAKPFRHVTPEELFNQAIEGEDLSTGALRLLTSGYIALKEAYDRPVNEIEQSALQGMSAYVAYTENVAEDMITEIVSSHFSVIQIKDIPSRLYQNAIEFLVDLEIGKVVN